MQTAGDRPFQYRNCHFLLSVVSAGPELFTPHVRYDHGLAGVERMPLPVDTEPYASSQEAWRHAEQQAVRWVHDRLGDGQGRF